MKKSFTLHFINHDVNIHFSALFNIVFIRVFINSFLSIFSALAAMIAITVVHELGHAYFAKKYKCKVLTIEVYFGGGHCSHEEPYYRREDYMIAWGGIIFQLVLFAAALVVWLTLYYFKLTSGYPIITDALSVLLGYNLFIVVINLLPIRGLDGYKAWRMFPNISLYLKLKLQSLLMRFKRKPQKAKVKPAVERDWLADSNRTKGLKGYKK